MKVEFTPTRVTFFREENDPKFYGVVNAKGESNLFYFIKNWLNNKGFSLIKKRMGKDGHLVDDIQQYLRISKKSSDAPHIYIFNGNWAIDGADVDWNKGEVTLLLETNVFNKQPDCYEKIIALGQKHGFSVKPLSKPRHLVDAH